MRSACAAGSASTAAGRCLWPDLIVELLRIDNEFITRISHTEPGNAKQYYKALIKDFQSGITSIVDRIVKLKETKETKKKKS